MNPLSLTHFPAQRCENESPALQMECDGFVDEAAVAALIAAPYMTRRVASHKDLALAADDLDFAGWSTAATVPLREVPSPSEVVDPVIRRAAPPVAEPGSDLPHQENHRLWLAGLAGALSTVLFSLLLLSFFISPGSVLKEIEAASTLTKALPPSPVAAPKKEAPVPTNAVGHRP